MNEPQDSSLLYSRKQINKAGDRIRRAAVRNEQPTANDLQLLNDYRAWHQPTLERCQRELVEVFHGEAGLDSLQQETAGAAEATVAYTLAAIKDWTFILGPGWMVGWGNGLILGYMMYRTQLVPRPWPWL